MTEQMSMRDKISHVVYMHHEGLIHGAADEIIAALPDMIAPLVWEGVEDDCYVTCGSLGVTYGLQVCDTLERRGEHVWSACVNNKPLVSVPKQASFSQAQAAANTHHRAAIMAAFKGEER